MIQNINLENVKGTTRTMDFQPLTVITGRNHAGKSAVLDALTLGLLGYLPALGKTNAATFRLASAKTMRVVLTAADGRKIERKWTAKGNGVTAKSEGAELLESALAVLEPRIFIAANSKTRLSMLAHLAGGQSLDDLGKKCEAWGPRFGLGPFEGDPLTVASSLMEIAAARAKNAKDAITMHRGTLQSLAVHDGPAQRITKEQREKAQAAVVKASAALQAARQLASDLEGKDQQAEAAAEALEAFGDMQGTGNLESLRKAIDQLSADHAEELKLLNDAKLKAAEKAAETVRLDALIAGRAIQDIGSAVDAAEAATETPEALAAVVTELCETEQRLGDIGRRCSGLSKTIADAQAEIQKLYEMECCPVCRASAEGWKANVLEYYRARDAEATDETGTLEKEREQLKDRFKELTGLHASIKEALALKDALPKNREALAAAVKLPKIRMAIKDLETFVELKEKKADELKQAMSAKADELKQCEKSAAAAAKADELRKIVGSRPAPEDIQAAMNQSMNAEAELEVAVAESEQLNTAALAAEQVKAMQARIQEAQEAIANHTELLTQFNELKDEIAAAQEEAIRETYAPIIRRANEFGAGVIARQVAVHNDELGYFGELGYSGASGFVPFEAMSGTEQTVVIAAIQAALSEKSGGFLMLDEMSRLDTANKFRFAKNIEAAISAGTLKQAVLVDHDGPAWAEFYTVAV